jgi:hypothetical protein
VQAQLSAEEFRRRVSSFEVSTEALGRAFGAMGRWGDGADLALASEIVHDLAQQPWVSGTTVWIEMRAYPAMLLLYAYGLGLLKGGRHEVLFRWFSQRIATSQRDSKPIVSKLLLGAWAGGDKNIWQQLKGLEGRKTPLSDHLHDVLSDWTKDYLLAAREFTRLFEEFEVLGALTFITLRATKEDLIAAHSATGQQDFVSSPIGRAAWDDEHRDAILASLEEPDTRRRLLDAGFARGDDQFLSLALESVRRLMGRFSW